MSLYTYKFTATRVVDGDTVDGIIDLGFRLFQRVRVRLSGFDAPETWRPKSEEEREAGKRVTLFLEELIAGKDLTIVSHKIDIYNRCIGELFIGDDSVNWMIINFIAENGLQKEQFYIA
jgi:micrococcal nuclease